MSGIMMHTIGLHVAAFFLCISCAYCARQTFRSEAVEMRWVDAIAFFLSGFGVWAVLSAIYQGYGP